MIRQIMIRSDSKTLATPIELMMFSLKEWQQGKTPIQSIVPPDFKTVCIICRTLDQCSSTCDEWIQEWKEEYVRETIVHHGVLLCAWEGWAM